MNGQWTLPEFIIRPECKVQKALEETWLFQTQGPELLRN